MEKLMRSTKKIEPIVNETKTKYMFVPWNPENIKNLKVGYLVFEQVKYLKYFVVNINR